MSNGIAIAAEAPDQPETIALLSRMALNLPHFSLSTSTSAIRMGLMSSNS
jgi:hypothetical protein